MTSYLTYFYGPSETEVAEGCEGRKANATATEVGVNQPTAHQQVIIVSIVSANFLREMEVMINVPSEDLKYRHGHLPRETAEPGCEFSLWSQGAGQGSLCQGSYQ